MIKTVTFTTNEKGALNLLADHIFSEHIDLVERLPEIKFVEGAASMFGSGDNVILEITIRYEEISQKDIEAIEQIISWAESSKAEIEIDYSK